MITQHIEAERVAYDRIYNLEARENIPYLCLDSVQFTCRKCRKSAYVDLSLVPVHEISIKCGACDTPLFLVQEEDFEHELQVVSEDLCFTE